MIETLAAHKVALMLGLALLGVVLVIRAKGGGSAAAGIPVDPYSSTPPSTAVGGSLSLPTASPYSQGGQDAPVAGDGPGTSTSTGPGAGPAVATTVTAPAYPDPMTPGAPGTPTNEFASGTGPVVLPVSDPVTGAPEAPLVGIDARMAHPTPAAVNQALATATAQSENYAKQFTAAAQGSYTAGF